MLAIIDYGMGNLRSVANAFEAIGRPAHVTANPLDLEKASAIVLPGVGAFGDGMSNLVERGFLGALEEEVLGKRKPYLGICLGMQFLAEESLEHGSHKGLGWVRGTVTRLMPQDKAYRVPHMGWNELSIERPSELFADLPERPIFYFVHSYHLEVAEADADWVTSTCWHGARIVASVQKGHVFGVQFHPEKSQRDGLQVLQNFLAFADQC